RLPMGVTSRRRRPWPNVASERFCVRRYEDDPVRAGVRVRTAPPEVAARGLEAPDPVADAPANDDLTDDDLTAEDLGADDLSAEDLRDDQLLLTDDPARDADPA